MTTSSTNRIPVLHNSWSFVILLLFQIVATHWIDLSEISNDGCNTYRFSLNAGFMPVFGPAWVCLYGSSRDYTFFDDNNFLNKGLEEGIGYRGRIMLAVTNEEGREYLLIHHTHNNNLNNSVNKENISEEKSQNL